MSATTYYRGLPPTAIQMLPRWGTNYSPKMFTDKAFQVSFKYCNVDTNAQNRKHLRSYDYIALINATNRLLLLEQNWEIRCVNPLRFFHLCIINTYFSHVMNKPIASIINRLKKASFFIPFTVYFVAFAAAVFVFKNLLGNSEIKADSSFADIFSLLLKVTALFAGVILVVSFLFVLISWLHFLYWKKKTGILLQIETSTAEQKQAEKQTVQIAAKPILKPLFGFLKIRLCGDFASGSAVRMAHPA